MLVFTFVEIKPWEKFFIVINFLLNTIQNLRMVICILGSLGIFAYLAYDYFMSHIQTAEPDQWMLVMENSQLKKSGIGIRCLVHFWQTSVKFKSQINSVAFRASQVTQEMQGIEIAGSAVWGIKKEEPLKYFIYMAGGNPNDTIRLLCESVVRNTIANTEI